MESKQPSRILVVQTAFLGDVVLTTPLFRGLSRRFPETSIDALVIPQAAPLIEEDPHLSGVLTYDKKGGETFRSALGTIRSGRYDLLVAPHRSPRTALLALMSGIPKRVGFSGSRIPLAYNHRIPRPRDQHEVDRNLSLLKGLGFEPEDEDRVLHVGYTDREAAEVEAVLARAGIAGGQALVALCPGSVWATKRWGTDGFAAVGRSLAADGYRVVLIGGPGDREVAAKVAAGVGAGAVDATGRTSLKALAAWMDRVRLVVTNDSAPLHVAAARGTPAVAVFGATTLDLGFGPFHERSRVLQIDLDCRPCGPHGSRVCPEGHFRCMGEITAEAVQKGCRELLGEGT